MTTVTGDQRFGRPRRAAKTIVAQGSGEGKQFSRCLGLDQKAADRRDPEAWGIHGARRHALATGRSPGGGGLA
jgi:hypothetical protein